MKQDTKWRLRDIEGKEYIIIDSEKVDIQEELNKTITKQMKEIERLNNIIKKIEKMFNHETLIKYYYGMSYEFEINDFKDDIFEIIKGSDKE